MIDKQLTDLPIEVDKMRTMESNFYISTESYCLILNFPQKFGYLLRPVTVTCTCFTVPIIRTSAHIHLRQERVQTLYAMPW